MPCSQGSCQKDGVWRPVLHLRSRKGGPSIPARFKDLACCSDHKEVMTVDDVLSDEAFVKISKCMRENGKRLPLHRNVTLSFEALSVEEQRKLAPVIEAAQPDPNDLPF